MKVRVHRKARPAEPFASASEPVRRRKLRARRTELDGTFGEVWGCSDKGLPPKAVSLVSIWLWVKTNGIPFLGVGAPPILGLILVGIGMFAGVRAFDPWPFVWSVYVVLPET